MLGYLDSETMEDGSVIIVVEAVIPLRQWLKERSEAVSKASDQLLTDLKDQITREILWGLKCIANALCFLHGTCFFLHGNMSLESIFVTVAGGDWKLGGFECCNTASGLMSGDSVEVTNLIKSSHGKNIIQNSALLTATQKVFQHTDYCSSIEDKVVALGMYDSQCEIVFIR